MQKWYFKNFRNFLRCCLLHAAVFISNRCTTYDLFLSRSFCKEENLLCRWFFFNVAWIIWYHWMGKLLIFKSTHLRSSCLGKQTRVNKVICHYFCFGSCHVTFIFISHYLSNNNEKNIKQLSPRKLSIKFKQSWICQI